MPVEYHISQFFLPGLAAAPRGKSLVQVDIVCAQFKGAHDAALGDADESVESLGRLYTALQVELPHNPEKTACLKKLHEAIFYDKMAELGMIPRLRLLLEARDCAVRALVAKPVGA